MVVSRNVAKPFVIIGAKVRSLRLGTQRTKLSAASQREQRSWKKSWGVTVKDDRADDEGLGHARGLFVEMRLRLMGGPVGCLISAIVSRIPLFLIEPACQINARGSSKLYEIVIDKLCSHRSEHLTILASFGLDYGSNRAENVGVFRFTECIDFNIRSHPYGSVRDSSNLYLSIENDAALLELSF